MDYGRCTHVEDIVRMQMHIDTQFWLDLPAGFSQLDILKLLRHPPATLQLWSVEHPQLQHGRYPRDGLLRTSSRLFEPGHGQVPHGYTSCVALPAVLRWNAQESGVRAYASFGPAKPHGHPLFLEPGIWEVAWLGLGGGGGAVRSAARRVLSHTIK